MKKYIACVSAIAALTCVYAIIAAPFAEAQVVGPSPQKPVQLTLPLLEVTQSTNTPSTTSGGEITYSLTVKNTGTAPATGLKLTDVLPVGFNATTTGNNTYHYTFVGNLDPGQTVVTSYTVRVDSELPANGTYVNVATVEATNHDPVTVRSSIAVTAPEVKRPETTRTSPAKTAPSVEPEGTVLGTETELAATGVGQLDVALALLGSGLVGAGALGLRRLRKP